MSSDPAADEPFDPNTFVVGTVLWVVVRNGPGDAPDPDSVVLLELKESGEPVGRMVPLFTDSDLAARFIEEGGRTREWSALRPAAVGLLVDLLAQLEADGVQHVTFDPAAGRPPRFWPIATAIATFSEGA